MVGGKMTATAKAAFLTNPSEADPYPYQIGLGNRFASEAVPDVLPKGQNAPQRVKYGLYSEQLNGAPVLSCRDAIRHVWMYRMRPSVAHGPVLPDPDLNVNIESCFSTSNSNVEFVASQQAWDPFPIPFPKDYTDSSTSSSTSSSAVTDFVQGIKTIGGQGDPTLREGVAVHVFSANVSMEHSALSNNDGEFLILPQHGRLNIQTELGWLMVRPGEVVVIPAGVRFRVLLPDGPVRGYIQEVFGTHYELPEFGAIGSNGLALPRDFESPVASFDIDDELWTVTYKLAGTLHNCKQNHSPFDVVAWHGNLVPYKYAMEKFVNMANANKDQADPTIYCVLTARSKVPGVPLTDFLVFTKKWITAEDTFRPPYYHRNMSTEVMGLIYGKYGGSSHVLDGGGLSYEASYMPHGETYDTWKDATTRELENVVICEDTMAFMFHISVPVLLTKWAIWGEGSESLHTSDPHQWDDLKAHFLDHMEEVNTDLKAAGLPALSQHK
ncbi:Homogentisate 1,2-dioxygenase [Metarhizium rileyi]|uniref:homogentisate 1,2-dioxygenase n=1 Tax=Metarhizium rileyi (strain RCEF 4871) TaxID=1649241 RepID=A0A167GRW3_METRR|nr:Homogentisate 1,2-dioxygenase [Metarhizium rileyi RCEF 4871]